jgi:DNA segregation ATPase FtsK/SpoIIIE, S-DNA-T family
MPEQKKNPAQDAAPANGKPPAPAPASKEAKPSKLKPGATLKLDAKAPQPELAVPKPLPVYGEVRPATKDKGKAASKGATTTFSATAKAKPADKLTLPPPNAKEKDSKEKAEPDIVINRASENARATNRRNTTSRRETHREGGRPRQTPGFHENDKLPPISNDLQHEIAGILLVVAGFILFSGMLFNEGWVGVAGGFFKRLFGLGAFLIPPMIMLIGATFVWEGITRRERINQGRIIGMIFMLISFLSIIQLLGGNPRDVAERGEGGGLFAYHINGFLSGIISGFGAFVFWLAFFLIGLMLALQMTLKDMGHAAQNGWRWLRGDPLLVAGEPLDDDYFDDDFGQIPREPQRPMLRSRGKVTPTGESDFLDDLLTGSSDPSGGRKGARIVVPEDEPAFTHSISLAGNETVIKSAVERPRRVPSATPDEPLAPVPLRPTANVPPPINSADNKPLRPMQQNWKRDDSEKLEQNNLPAREWHMPQINMLANFSDVEINSQELLTKAKIIEKTLASFGVDVTVREVNTGPTVTQFALEPGIGVKVARITTLANDLALALAAPTIRIEAPVPGQSRVGIEVPNAKIATVGLREIMEADEFGRNGGKLKFALGRDVSGQPIVADLAKMPHLLIAGSTGSGKSVCLNSIVAGYLLQYRPTDLQFIMIDPKMVELSTYNGIPHLRFPVVTQVEADPERERKQNNSDRAPTVMSVLKWSIREMERRYKTLSLYGHRNLESYNKAAAISIGLEKLPYMVIIIDELADLMMVAPEEAESAICRLAQKARAVGIHLILATQRPSVDVVTGLIKANFPSRITFAVTSQIDSRVILDMAGAEKLLGRGDMLYLASDAAKPMRVQGVYVGDDEIDKIVKHWRKQNEFLTGESKQFKQVEMFQELLDIEAESENTTDELFEQALEIVRETKTASTSLLQRRLRIGYNRAARLIDELAQAGLIGPADGSKPRSVLTDDDMSNDTHSLTAAAAAFEPEPARPVATPPRPAAPAVRPAASSAPVNSGVGASPLPPQPLASRPASGNSNGRPFQPRPAQPQSADYDPDPPI